MNWKEWLNDILGVEKKVGKFFWVMEKRLEKKINKIKRKIMLEFLSFVFIFASLTCITVGLLIFLQRFIALDVLLFAAGAVFLYVAFMIKLMK